MGRPLATAGLVVGALIAALLAIRQTSPLAAFVIAVLVLAICLWSLVARKTP